MKNDQEENKNLRTPIHIIESEYKFSPIHPFDRIINGRNKFAITAATGNGKFIRGGLLYYKLSDVEIYAPINSVLMINTNDNSVFIKIDKDVAESIAPADPEAIEYVILYTDIGYESEDEPFRWVKVRGRTNAYNSIKDNATMINVDQSIIIAESVKLSDALTIREFCEHLKNAGLTDEEDFDINDYAGTDYI